MSLSLRMVIDADVVLEVASHEALVRQTYKDSAGVLTWCVGMTNATGRRVERYIGKPQTVQHCMDIYAWALSNCRASARGFQGATADEGAVRRGGFVPLEHGRNRAGSLGALLARGETEKARSAFMNWIMPKEIAGRRAKERDLFFDGIWSNDATMTEFTCLARTCRLTDLRASGSTSRPSWRRSSPCRRPSCSTKHRSPTR